MKKILGHRLVLSLLIIAGLVLVNSQGWLEVPKDVFFRLTGSGQKIIYQFSLRIDNFIRSHQENIQLNKENERLLGELSQLKEVVQENELLRQQINLADSEPRQLILANVVGQEVSGLGKYFLIDKGLSQGVKEKAAVVAAGNLLVGQIIESSESLAKVQLITDPNSRINARIQESRLTGLIKGGQGLNLIIDLLPQGRTIENGQTVITSGLAGLLPSGLLIGQIEKVVSADVQISQEAQVKPAVDFQSLEKVFIIK